MHYYVEERKLLNFMFGNRNSREFKMVVTETNHLNSYERDFETTEVPGRTGELLIDNKRLKNKTIDLTAYIDCEDISKTLDETILEVEEWLLGKVEYRELKFSDVSKVDNAICTKAIPLEELDGFIKYGISFNCFKNTTFVPIKSFSLNKSETSLTLPVTEQLTALFEPSNSTNKRIIWTTSNKQIATVGNTGVITPVSPGECVITASTTDGYKQANCKVLVRA